jgi:hypothetical protein
MYSAGSRGAGMVTKHTKNQTKRRKIMKIANIEAIRSDLLHNYRRQSIWKLNEDQRFFIGLRYGHIIELLEEELLARGEMLEEIECTSPFYKKRG